MYAVLSSGGKQYRVEAGTTLMLERLDGQPGEPGAQVTFDRVLLIGDGDDVTIGTPTVAGASVSATILGEALGPKLVIFKFKQKVKYRRRTGHRQHMTRVRIDAINPTAARKPASRARAEEAEAPAEAMKAAPRAAKPRAPRAKMAASDAAKLPAEPAAEKPKARRATKPKAEE
ncbi:MAG TPA: 50S ribosomal protein L21 [Candidatus Limnocylindria bacterium]|jgi:large subunit ribosomal protein L21|nr:50S ribosomal protein L21 [Candidatus Limnocylindria bacterium]